MQPVTPYDEARYLEEFKKSFGITESSKQNSARTEENVLNHADIISHSSIHFPTTFSDPKQSRGKKITISITSTFSELKSLVDTKSKDKDFYDPSSNSSIKYWIASVISCGVIILCKYSHIC
jgi:hypothetical protein